MNREREIIIKLDKIEDFGSIKDIDFLVNSIKSSNYSISDKAFNILCNVKKVGFVEKIIEKLKKSELETEKILLISICWQSSMDFSPYMELFVDFAIKGSLELTIESFSAIENIIDQNTLDKVHINNYLNSLEVAIKSQKDEKLELLKELINVLNKI